MTKIFVSKSSTTPFHQLPVAREWHLNMMINGEWEVLLGPIFSAGDALQLKISPPLISENSAHNSCIASILSNWVFDSRIVSPVKTNLVEEIFGAKVRDFFHCPSHEDNCYWWPMWTEWAFFQPISIVFHPQLLLFAWIPSGARQLLLNQFVAVLSSAIRSDGWRAKMRAFPIAWFNVARGFSLVWLDMERID